MLSNGLLVQIQVCLFSGDVQEINFDKYLVGKLSEHISDGNAIMLSARNHLLYTKDNMLLYSQ